MLTLTPEQLAVATDEELALYEESLKLRQALLSPLDLAAYCNPGYTKRFAHQELLNRYLVAFTNHALYEFGIGVPAEWVPDPDDPEDGRWLNPASGEEAIQILTISMPPQHGKSFLTTEHYPAWYLLLNPDHRVVVTGYEANFAKGFGRKNRDLIDGHPEFGLLLDKSSRAADEFNFQGEHRGGLKTAGAMGGITGNPAHLIVVDDPISNNEDALSPTHRKKMWDWWRSVITTRLQKGGLVVVMATRWHEDDLPGRVSRKERTFVLNLPALAFGPEDGAEPTPEGISTDPDTGTPDLLGRQPGQALCPALHPRSELLHRRDVGDDNEDEPGGILWFQAMYQGKPNIEGGGIIPKPFRYYTVDRNCTHPTVVLKYNNGVTSRVPISDLIKFATCDLAMSKKDRADWTVFSYWGYTPNGELLLLDRHRERMESPDHLDSLKTFWTQVSQSWGPGRFAGIEDKTFGSALIQAALRDGGLPVRPLTADTDKIARAIPAGMWIRQDRLFFPSEAEWLKEWEKELTAFPNGTHDDQVDTMAYAQILASAIPKRRPPSENTPTNLQQKMEKFLRERLDGKRVGARYHPVLGRL